MKINYFVIPLITFAVAWLGRTVTMAGMDWYQTLTLPAFAPPGEIIGLVWAVIYTLTTIAFLLVWNRLKRGRFFWLIVLIFAFNAYVNFLWSYLYFGINNIGVAIYGAVLIFVSVLVLIVLLWKKLKEASYLLIPYALWVLFATFLNYIIWTLN